MRHGTDLRSSSDTRIIQGLHERWQGHTSRFHVQGTVNPSIPLKLGGSVATSSLDALSKSSFMLEHWAFGEYNFESLDVTELELTPAAQELLKDPDQFREQYGDYFIVGYQRRYHFHALLECK